MSVKIEKDTFDVALELYVNFKAIKEGGELVASLYDGTVPESGDECEPPAKRGRNGAAKEGNGKHGGKVVVKATGRGKGRGKKMK